MDLSGALKIKAKDVKAPPLAPPGHYRFRIADFKFGEIKSPKGEWETLDFQCVAEEALEDVNAEELAKAGGAKAIRLRNSFMFSKVTDEESQAEFDRTMFFLKRFLEEHCGVEDDGNMAKMVNDAKGAVFIGSVGHREDKERGRTFAQIDRTMPITADLAA